MRTGIRLLGFLGRAYARGSSGFHGFIIDDVVGILQAI